MDTNMASNPKRDLYKKFWDWRLMEFPEFATFVGIHLYDDKLQSYSLKSIENRKLTAEKFLKEANELFFDSNIMLEDKFDLSYFICNLDVFIKGHTAKGYFFPLSYLDGVHIEFERLLNAMKKEDEADYLKILGRMSQLPCQISEIIELMREGIRNEMTFHLVSVSGILKQLDMLQKEPEETIFYKPFKTIPEDISFSKNSKTELLSKAKNAIAENILPAFKELKNFLENEYFKHLRPEVAISSLIGGEIFYQMCLDYHLSCTMTPQEIHELGLKEVERIKEKMEKCIESLKLKMSLKEFSNHLKENSEFKFKTVDELLETYRETVFNCIEPKLPQLFNYLPKSKLVIEPYPSSVPNAPGAYYYAGAFDGSRPGKFLINTANLNSSPKYDVMTLALHESVPGHHLQNSYLIEKKNIPEFRSFLEDRRYTEAPSLFPLYTAFCEGWALYCEHLGYELGLYEDVYLEYGHLSNEMLRACRLVVDTGIHMFGWSHEKAVDYLLENTAFHKTEIENEINRYITWPGQACGYKIGELKLKSLREQAESAIVAKFDIREFHDIVLQTFGPLHLLENRITDYINSNKS